MEALGDDGSVTVNDSHIIIEWKTLRGRLSSQGGSNLESIPISRVFEAILIPAKPEMKGCLQINLIGSENTLAFEENWMSTMNKNNLHHAVLFGAHAQFQFRAIAEHIHEKIQILRAGQPAILFGPNSSQKFA